MQRPSRIIAGFVVLALLLLCGCTQKPAELQPFSSAEGGFSVLMPGAPKYEATTVDTAVGPIIMHSYMVEDAGMAYGVVYSDYPEFMKDADPEAVLDGGRDGAIEKIKGTLVSESPVTLGGYPGRDITVSAGQLSFRARMYLVEARAYNVIITAPTEKLSLPVVEEVLNSFKLTESPDVIDACSKEEFKCVGDCVDGFGETCYYDSAQYNGDDLDMGLHTPPEETKAACMGLHSYAVCGSCFNRFELRKNRALVNVSCEEFHTAIEDANRTCGGCVKKATAGCC